MTLILPEKPSLDELILKHYGVKGMRWGVRKERSSSAKKPRTPEERKRLARNISIAAGILIVVAGTAYAGYHLKQHGSLNTSLIKKGVKKVGEEAAKKIIEEPTDVMHFARGKNQGFRFLRKSDVTEPLRLLDESGLSSGSSGIDTLRAFGRNGSMLAVSLSDPRGRTDRAGRRITHDIVIPSSMASGITTIADVREKVWPLLESDYDVFYQESLRERS